MAWGLWVFVPWLGFVAYWWAREFGLTKLRLVRHSWFYVLRRQG